LEYASNKDFQKFGDNPEIIESLMNYLKQLEMKNSQL